MSSLGLLPIGWIISLSLFFLLSFLFFCFFSLFSSGAVCTEYIYTSASCVYVAFYCLYMLFCLPKWLFKRRESNSEMLLAISPLLFSCFALVSFPPQLMEPSRKKNNNLAFIFIYIFLQSLIPFFEGKSVSPPHVYS